MSRVFYVDALNGSDANAGTAPEAAWQSIDMVNSASLQPGDTVLFARGRTWEGTLKVDESGTADAPITFGAYGEGAAPIIDGGDHAIVGENKHHIVVQGLDLRNTDDVAIFVSDSSHWTFDQLNFDHTGVERTKGGGGIQSWYSDEMTVSNSTFTNVTGDSLWFWDTDGLRILNNHFNTNQGGTADNVHIYDATNFEIRGNYMDMSGDTNSGKGNLLLQNSHDGVVAGNIFNGGAFGLSVHASNATVEGNRFIGHNKAKWSAGILSGNHNDVENLTIQGNLFEDSRAGIYLFGKNDREGITIQGNVFENPHDAALKVGRSTPLGGSFAHNIMIAQNGAALTKVSGSKGDDWIETENVTATDMIPVAAEIYTRFGLDPAQYLTT